MTKVKTVQVKQGFGVFTVVALMLLAVKLFAGYSISYTTIILIWLLPLWIVLGIVGIALVVGLIATLVLGIKEYLTTKR